MNQTHINGSITFVLISLCYTVFKISYSIYKSIYRSIYSTHDLQADRLSAILGMVTTLSNNAADQCLKGYGKSQSRYSYKQIYEMEKRQWSLIERQSIQTLISSKASSSQSVQWALYENSKKLTFFGQFSSHTDEGLCILRNQTNGGMCFLCCWLCTRVG